MSLMTEFVDYSARKLAELDERIGVCLEQLSEEQVWARGKDNENAIGNLMLHLCGNVRQWILSDIAGKPDHRNRPAEFAARSGVSKAELRQRLHDTVAEAVAAIRSLPEERLAERHTLQGYEVSIMEAIYHVVEHFSMHTGQIIFATKLLTSADLGFYRHLDSGAAQGKATP